uniref:RING-type E3 ubiquitin transferase n=1 Tax=Rhinolophus ferrumequinum TaxID=59479 RepID=A0A671ES86_RHIFE
MASGILLHIQEELTCPICLELLTEPLSLDCGHSFCKACITANNKEPEISQKGKSLCPVCRFSYHPGDLRPNRFVANIVERLREVKVSPEEGQKRDLCVRHGEKLHLFCKEDGKVICWLCERSQEHRDHHTFLIEEVAQEYQEKLEAALERLKTEQKKAEMYNSNIRKEENQIQHDIQSFQNCIKQLKDVLDSEEQKELQKLKNEEGHILHTLAESEKKLVRQSQLVGDLISALEHRLQGSAIEMLQVGLGKKSESWTWKKPKIVSTKLKSAFQAPDLSRILQEFKGEGRQVRVFMFRNVYPCNFSAFDVLGCQNFSSGKYYWEVDVSQKIAWILGVYSNTSDLNRKRSSGFVFNPHINYLNVYYRFRPDNGYWVVGLQNESEYNAFEDSSTSDPKVLTLSMAVPPCRVGVFLDYEAGTVSFFNVTNHGSLIYKFSKCRFSQAAYPYFNPWNCPSPMTLCQPNS